MKLSSAATVVIEEDIQAILSRDIPWQEFSGKRVVVTGGGGFIGGYLVRTLLALNRFGLVNEPVTVVAPVRNIKRAEEKLPDCIGNSHFILANWDLSFIGVPEFGDVNYVIHNASQASPKYYGIDPMGTMMPNVVGTAGLLSMLSKASDPKGFLYVSSSEIYGSISCECGVKESDCGALDPLNPRSCYAESKRAGEALCVAFYNQHSIPAWVVRPFHTYGPGLLADDGRVFSDFAYSVARNENIVMNSDGSARRAFCYVSDAVAGFFTVMLKGKPAAAYNVGNGEAELSVSELADLLVRLFPEKNLRVERCIESDPAGYLRSAINRVVPDTSSLERIGWRASVAPCQGFQRMIATLA